MLANLDWKTPERSWSIPAPFTDLEIGQGLTTQDRPPTLPAQE